MSADIFFSKKRHLNLRMGVFLDLIERARIRCKDDPAAAKQLAMAEEAGCLGIERLEDRLTQTKLAECLRAAAAEWLDELRPNPTRPLLMDLLERVSSFSDELLKELRDQ
jgi:hypothetical protein